MKIYITSIDDCTAKNGYLIKTINFIENGPVDVIITDCDFESKYRVWFFSSQVDIYKYCQNQWTLLTDVTGSQSEKNNVIEAAWRLKKL